MGARTNRFIVLGHILKDPILMRGEQTTGRTIMQVVPDYKGTKQYAILPLMAMGKKSAPFVAMVKKGDIVYCEGRICSSTKITPSGKYYVKPVFKVLDFMVLKRDAQLPIGEIDVISTMHAYSPERFMKRKEDK
jgi:hypothetical protein